jgi:hypothetical protein
MVAGGAATPFGSSRVGDIFSSLQFAIEIGNPLKQRVNITKPGTIGNTDVLISQRPRPTAYGRGRRGSIPCQRPIGGLARCSAVDRPHGREEVLLLLEKRAGPAARKMFEDFITK